MAVFGILPANMRLSTNRSLVTWVRKLGLGAFFCGGLLLFTGPGRAGETAAPQVAPPGSWVKPQFFDQAASASLLDSGADEHVLLLERQINAVQNETFVHSMRQILTLAGVQKEANLTIAYNPGYESLTLHWVRLWRSGQHLERLDTNQIKVVQPEREMNEFILNGEKSAILVLEDVRVGDVLDYAYSVKGANPVFGGHFSAEIPVQLEQPAERLLTRVLWPPQRQLRAKAHGCSVQPTATTTREGIEYVWDLRQVPALTLEDSLPDWYDPVPWVQLSEFKTWSDVNQWAGSLFQVTSPLSPELSRQVAAWKQLASPEEQVLAALHFVQDQVRYFGIEIGASTERPGDPSAVFARRFGDCKDKSLLFVTLVRALGFEANPVLVNATLGRAIENWQPSASDFDHCIAVVQCNGQTYWLDPTMNYQCGPLAAHYLPAYDCGLVICPATTGLTLIPRSAVPSQTATTEYFQLRGRSEAADLKVVTLAEGRDAEALRQYFATTKRADIEKSDTRFYADNYPGIRMTAPVVLEDDPLQNRVQTTEFYAIDNVWGSPDKNGKLRCDFYPSGIAAWLRKPADLDRHSPLGVSFPQHQILRTEVILPGAWPAESGHKSVSDAAFSLQRTLECNGNKLVMEYDYRALADSVFPGDIGTYLQRLTQASQMLGYGVIWK